jgi:TPR repeat protein
MHWLRKAADEGCLEAAGFIGILYENGQGVPVDLTEAVKLYRHGAEAGDPIAQP